MLGIPRRFSHFVYGFIQSGLTCDCGGDCEFPLLGRRNVRDALAAVLAFCLDHDVADCAVRCTGYSKPDAHPDEGRLTV